MHHKHAYTHTNTTHTHTQSITHTHTVVLQAAGLVPIVEPEILLDGNHGIERTLEVAEAVWAETFK